MLEEHQSLLSNEFVRYESDDVRNIISETSSV